jgi:hypothetical protein
MTDVYIVVVEDRHANAEVIPFTSEQEAIAFAGMEVDANARHPEDIEPEDRTLNESMKRDGWVWYCRYSGEGDSVRVLRRELRGQETE